MDIVSFRHACPLRYELIKFVVSGWWFYLVFLKVKFSLALLKWIMVHRQSRQSAVWNPSSTVRYATLRHSDKNNNTVVPRNKTDKVEIQAIPSFHNRTARGSDMNRLYNTHYCSSLRKMWHQINFMLQVPPAFRRIVVLLQSSRHLLVHTWQHILYMH